MAIELLYSSLRLPYHAILTCLGQRHNERTTPLLRDVEQRPLLDEKVSVPAKDNPRRVIVRLPDIFSASFGLVRNPPINPHHEVVTMESEAWLVEAASLDARMQKFIRKVNIGYCFSMFTPTASPAGLRVLLEWGAWAFPFDDQFDDGLMRNGQEAQDTIDSLLASMYPNLYTIKPTPIDNLVRAHDDFWYRVQASSTSSIARRYATTMQRYGAGLVEQVKLETVGRKINSSVQEILETRRRTVGAEPVLPLIELALGLNIPDEVFEHWTIKEFERISIDIVIISNDIVSYRKEEAENNPHNMVAAARRSGMAAQQAFDHVGAMLEARYNDWERAFAALPSWSEAVDRDVKQYVQSVKNVAIGSNVWSFSTERYFGKMTQTVKETMITDVLADEDVTA